MTMSERRMYPTPDANMGTRGGTPKRGPRASGAKRCLSLNDVVKYQDTAPDVSQLSRFSAEDFPASPIPLLVEEADLATSATDGLSSLDSFASLNPDGSWRKTCQGYSQVNLDGSLERFSETWPRAGMTRNGIAYQRQPLAPLTDVIGSGLWPTPRVEPGNFSTVNGKRYETSLQSMARRGLLWPTPCAEDAKNVAYQKGKQGQRYPMLLGAVRPEKMWPTPTNGDS